MLSLLNLLCPSFGGKQMTSSAVSTGMLLLLSTTGIGWFRFVVTSLSLSNTLVVLWVCSMADTMHSSLLLTMSS